jgi:hypothetical protein
MKILTILEMLFHKHEFQYSYILTSSLHNMLFLIINIFGGHTTCRSRKVQFLFIR